MEGTINNPGADERYLSLASAALSVADKIAEALDGLTQVESDLVLNAALSLHRVQRAAVMSPTLGATLVADGGSASEVVPGASAPRPVLVMQKKETEAQ